MNTVSRSDSFVELGEKFFKFRDYTPIPLVLLLLIFGKPSALTATVGMLLIFAGELVRVYSVSFIGSISRTRKDNTGSNLITDGPFAYVRNPLYVGNFFISFGISVIGGSIAIMVLTIILFSVQYFFIVKYEESILKERFGEIYAAYCRMVPAWLPSRVPRLDDIIWPDTFAPAIRSERRTLTAIFAIVFLLVVIR